MGNYERNKGARFERELASYFREHGIHAHRGYVQFRQSDVIGLPGIHVEAKFQENSKIREWMRQATDEAKKRHDGAPTVFWKKSREQVLVTMYLDDWIELYKGGTRYDAERDYSEAFTEMPEEGDHLGGGLHEVWGDGSAEEDL